MRENNLYTAVSYNYTDLVTMKTFAIYMLYLLLMFSNNEGLLLCVSSYNYVQYVCNHIYTVLYTDKFI